MKTQDAQDAKAFAKKPPEMLQPEGVKLKLKVIAQVAYIVTISKLNENLPNKIYKISRCGVATVMSIVLNKAKELCSQNINLQSRLVVSLLKAAVAKATSPKGSNSKTDVKVLNFICFIRKYDKKAAQVVSEDIGGTGDQWVRKMNARDQKNCIIDRGE